MKTTIKKLMFCALALLAVGSVKAETEVYDFTALEGNPINQDAEHYAAGTTLYLLAVADNNFNNRFAIGPNSRTGANGFYFRKANTIYKGLYSQYKDRIFSILNLVKGNRVTLTLSNNVETLKFVGGDAVVSGKTYTVAANGNLDFVTTDGVYIEKVVIVDPVSSETITIGSVGYSNTADFTEKDAFVQERNPLTSSEGDAFSNFSLADGVKIGDTGYDVQFVKEYGLKFLWANKYLTIKSLKEGEKVTFTFTGSTLNVYGTSLLEGVSTNGTLTSGTAYTVITDGSLVLNPGKGTNIKSISIEKEAVNTGGATLVSENALDFTDVDDIKAYVASSASAGSVTFKQVKKVPANTPLYLTAETAVSVEVPVLDGDAETIATNLLKGSASATTSLISTAETKYYVFGVLNDEAGFYPVSTSKALTSAAGKAYLQLTAAQAAARINMLFADESETTGIQTVAPAVAAGGDAVFNLRGQRVAQSAKGLYIVNGKKVMFK